MDGKLKDGSRKIKSKHSKNQSTAAWIMKVCHDIIWFVGFGDQNENKIHFSINLMCFKYGTSPIIVSAHNLCCIKTFFVDKFSLSFVF